MTATRTSTADKGIAEEVEKGEVGVFDRDDTHMTRQILWKLDTR